MMHTISVSRTVLSGKILNTISMSYELHRSGVVTGSLNCFCLACDALLQCAHDAAAHVRTAQHQHQAGAVNFCDKFPHEHIKKFKRGYYCEFCNVLMPIASKVNVHIAEDEHKHNKGVLLLKPLALDVVAFNNVLIEENAWHGLMQGVCSLCNAEFEDEADHKAEAEHSLNLVLKPVQFGANNAIYRHLDDTAVQCLTCNKLLAPGKMSKHFIDTDHLELYAKRRIETNGACQGIEAEKNRQEKVNDTTLVTKNEAEINLKIDNEGQNKRADKNNNEKSSTKDKSKILESIVKYQTKGINIHLETETAFCKKCSQVVPFSLDEIENHIDNHSSATVVDSDLLYPSNLDQHLNRVDINDKTTQSSDDQRNDDVNFLKAIQDNVLNDSSSEEDNDTDSTCSVGDLDIPSTENYNKDNEEEASDFAKANDITYNKNIKQSFCRICEVHLPSSFKSLKEHVDGAHHKRLVASSKSSITQVLPKEKTIEFINSSYIIKTFFYTASLFNEKYCIFWDSFYLIFKNGSRMKCFVCDINLPPYSDAEDHVKTFQHTNLWKKVPVITSEKNEFIREVRPGLYHCGFCHLLVSGWTDMKKHLECSDHQKHKTIWESRLRLHLPEVQQHRMQEQMEYLVRRRFWNMFN
ncbi:hypothetical protein PYW08_009777 [Mythimna loreyi]|uniref:Uncharacterized protein n=1 Tax=Mythimna loreyi TaxID=667449 RepID=A0ACC2Q821_9NEOP|nr:hypothetical protein PYW08_009777 [Mythimna loreyi]